MEEYQIQVQSRSSFLRRSIIGTGGGAGDIRNLDPVSEKVCGMLPEQIKSLGNNCENDAECQQDKSQVGLSLLQLRY